MLRWWQ
ncbi:hypothetical protein CIB84_014223 [Bambusicola thoracicus]|nr:hypothetical protein CIB84_014223 [Bambusicola thoracicus]